MKKQILASIGVAAIAGIGLAAGVAATARAVDRTVLAQAKTASESGEQTAGAESAQGYLATIRRYILLGSTVPANGDLNPYAIVVAPASAGKIHKDDVLLTNFNNKSNLQGAGTTIMLYDPSSKRMSMFASLPQHAEQCPGGVGLGTAMTMLKSGWVIVGSTPSTDGTTKTKGDGCLLVLDANGKLATAWTGANINDPWGNMAVVDHGDTATLFISMAGFGVVGPDTLDAKTHEPVTVNKATVLRIELSTAAGKPPTITSETVVANGFGQRADKGAFLIGPTGLALGSNDTLYVSDAVGNRIVAVEHATTRTSSAGTGRVVTAGGLLKRPLAMTMSPLGTLLVTNALNGQVVEVDTKTGKQLGARWIDNDQAQSPPGNGDLFGIAMAPNGGGFYYVKDDVNALVEAAQ
jgi:hypothetical protein